VTRPLAHFFKNTHLDREPSFPNSFHSPNPFCIMG
jgi:hypothetical protein